MIKFFNKYSSFFLHYVLFSCNKGSVVCILIKNFIEKYILSSPVWTSPFYLLIITIQVYLFLLLLISGFYDLLNIISDDDRRILALEMNILFLLVFIRPHCAWVNTIIISICIGDLLFDSGINFLLIGGRTVVFYYLNPCKHTIIIILNPRSKTTINISGTRIIILKGSIILVEVIIRLSYALPRLDL